MAEEGAQQKLAGKTGTDALVEALKRLGPPTDAFGQPMIKISAAAAELVPTVQYGNATIGPVVVERWIHDGDAAHVKAEIRKLTAVVEEAVAEDRQTLHEQIRARAN